MNKLLLLPIAVFFLCIVSCSQEETPKGECFYFDERQCQTDPWYSDTKTGSLDSLVSAYLSSKQIKVNQISVKSDYHTVVCEACNICPVGPRVYVKISADDVAKLESEKFLNFAKDKECLAQK